MSAIQKWVPPPPLPEFEDYYQLCDEVRIGAVAEIFQATQGPKRHVCDLPIGHEGVHQCKCGYGWQRYKRGGEY